MSNLELLKGLLYGSSFTNEQIEEALKKTKEIAEKQGLIKEGGQDDSNVYNNRPTPNS